MNKKLIIENRIKKLEARTTKDNAAIVRKLKRQLNKISQGRHRMICYTDGSCSGNGTNKAKGGYASSVQACIPTFAREKILCQRITSGQT